MLPSQSVSIDDSNNVLQIEKKVPLLIVNGNHNALGIDTEIQSIIINGTYNTLTFSPLSSINTIAIYGSNNTCKTIKGSAITIEGNSNSITTSVDFTSVSNNGTNNSISRAEPTFTHTISIGGNQPTHSITTQSINVHRYTSQSTNSFSIVHNTQSHNSLNISFSSNTVNNISTQAVNLSSGNTLSQNIVSLNFPPHVANIPSETIYGKDETIDCSICLDKIKNGDKIRALACNHCFHTVCIDKWISESTTCPLCKAYL